MPEGPSLVILKELVTPFAGKKVTEVGGNAKVEKERAAGQKVIAIKTWGKHLLICFKDFTIRIHLMLFGSYRINEEKDAKPRLSLHFGEEYINFYACSVKIIDEPLDEVYDWSADIMAEEWSSAGTRKKLKQHPDMLVCDALMDQHIFSGCGNIIKNEVLFRIKVNPLSTIGALPAKQLKLLTDETHKYAFQFLEWKRKYELKKHWLAYSKKICPRCDIPFEKRPLGKGQRRTFYCNNCQVLYNEEPANNAATDAKADH